MMIKIIIISSLLCISSAFALDGAELCPKGTQAQDRTVVVFAVDKSVRGSEGHLKKHFAKLLEIFKNKSINNVAGLIQPNKNGNVYSLYVVPPSPSVSSKDEAMRLVSLDPNSKKGLFKIKAQKWIDCVR